jgi:hypothetical protein
MKKHQIILRQILILTLFFGGLISLFAQNQRVLESPVDSRVKIEGSEKYIILIYDSDSILLNNSLSEFSCLFQLVELHHLFFKNHDCHSIRIDELKFNPKGSNKKKKFVDAKGKMANYRTPYEWIIRVENENAIKKMDLNEFLLRARAALVEIKIVN